VVEVGGILLGSKGPAGSMVRLGLDVTIDWVAPKLEAEEMETEVTLTGPWPETRVNMAGVVEVVVFITEAPSPAAAGVIVTPPAELATGSPGCETGTLVVVTGLPPFRPMKAPQPPLTGRPPLRPRPPLPQPD
jgi:hypothetical protein